MKRTLLMVAVAAALGAYHEQVFEALKSIDVDGTTLTLNKENLADVCKAGMIISGIFGCLGTIVSVVAGITVADEKNSEKKSLSHEGAALIHRATFSAYAVFAASAALYVIS